MTCTHKIFNYMAAVQTKLMMGYMMVYIQNYVRHWITLGRFVLSYVCLLWQLEIAFPSNSVVDRSIILNSIISVCSSVAPYSGSMAGVALTTKLKLKICPWLCTPFVEEKHYRSVCESLYLLMQKELSYVALMYLLRDMGWWWSPQSMTFSLWHWKLYIYNPSALHCLSRVQPA